MDVYLNGQIVPYDQASIPLEDAGFQHAIGLFETMSCHHGSVFRLQAHMQRIADSATQLGLVRTIKPEGLAQAVEHTISHNRLERARIRLTLTAGPVSLLRKPDEKSPPPEPTIAIVPTPAMEYDPAYFEQGITALVAPQAANPFDPTAGHKTLAYWSRLMLLRRAANAGAGEAIILNVTNHIASGAISNLFAVKDGELLTPIARGEEEPGSLPAPVLPGITRQAVIEIAETEGIAVRRKMISVPELLESDEIFLTNSSWQILPVARVEKREIGKSGAGPITTSLRSTLLQTIDEECSRG